MNHNVEPFVWFAACVAFAGNDYRCLSKAEAGEPVFRSSASNSTEFWRPRFGKDEPSFKNDVIRKGRNTFEFGWFLFVSLEIPIVFDGIRCRSKKCGHEESCRSRRSELGFLLLFRGKVMVHVGESLFMLDNLLFVWGKLLFMWGDCCSCGENCCSCGGKFANQKL